MPRRATKQQIAVTVGLFVAVAAAGFWWSPHIWWSYILSRKGINVPAVKVGPMPESKPSGVWFTCRAGALSLRLPAAMADEAERSVARDAHSAHALVLTSPTHELALRVPFELPAGRQPFIVLMAETVNMSPIEFIAESYRASTDDFSWAMSRAALRRHQKLLELWALYPHYGIMNVETLSDDSLEGLLVFYEDRAHATFEWQLKSRKAAGYLKFAARQGELNVDDVRAVCQSVSCDESRLGPELGKDQLAVLADTMPIDVEDR